MAASVRSVLLRVDPVTTMAGERLARSSAAWLRQHRLVRLGGGTYPASLCLSLGGIGKRVGLVPIDPSHAHGPIGEAGTELSPEDQVGAGSVSESLQLVGAEPV